MVLDAGGSLAPRDAGPGHPAWPQAVVKAEIVAEAFAAAGVDAMAVGGHDWRLGLPKILALREAHDLPILAANLRCGDERPFPSTRAIEAGGVRIGVVGFTAGEVDGCTVEPVDEAAQRAVAELGEVDLLVALAPLPRTQVYALPLAVDGLDLLLDGAGGRRFDQPQDVAHAWWMGPGHRGQNLGQIDLLPVEGASRWAPVEHAEEAGASAFRWRVRPLSREVRDHVGGAAIVEAGKRRVAALETPTEPPVAGPRVVEDGPFAGGDTCTSCHPDEAAQWTRTGHAQAWAHLQASGRSLDRQCVGCHVTGWEADGGPSAPADAMPLRDVQCEACHGPARAHVADPSGVRPVRAPALQVCTACHDGVQDQGRFDAARYLPRVAHDAEVTAP